MVLPLAKVGELERIAGFRREYIGTLIFHVFFCSIILFRLQNALNGSAVVNRSWSSAA